MATDPSLEKTLPGNLEAERSVLGAILLDDKALYTVIEKLRVQRARFGSDGGHRPEPVVPSGPELCQVGKEHEGSAAQAGPA